jgi:hypothetical protein
MRVDIIYAETLEQLDVCVQSFLDTTEGRNWEPSGGPFQDRDGRRWGWAVRRQRGAAPPVGEVNLRGTRR